MREAAKIFIRLIFRQILMPENYFQKNWYTDTGICGISRIISTPEYDPYDLDIKLKDKLNYTPTKEEKDSIRTNAQDITTIKTLNFTNVRKIKTDGKQPKIWSVTNFDFNYSYIQTEQHNPLIENDEMRRTRAGIGYNYAPQPKYCRTI